MVKKINIIVAIDLENWIWKNWDLAWKISKDLKYFKDITLQTKNINNKNMVVMGRKTWESIPDKYKPLPWRINAVLTRNKDFNNDLCVNYSSIEEMFKETEKKKNIENIFIIGWANIYNQVLKKVMIDKIYITKIEKIYWCDVFFGNIPENFILEWSPEKQEENWVKFRFEVYKKID